MSGWWSSRYSRPIKDPLLQTYTLEELLYEYFLHTEKDVVDAEQIENAKGKEEDDKLDAEEAWADQMEAEFEAELEAERKKTEQEEWMKKQLEEESQEFKEDLSINFEDT